MRHEILVGTLTILLVLAGCLSGDETAGPAGEDGDAHVDENLTGHGMTFTEPKLIDETRAGGEPVIAITHEGSVLVSAHPGWTHVHPSDDPTNPPTEAITPANGQSYLWRSTDNGSTWSHIGTPGADGDGPRGAGFGVSDPDFTVADDRIYRTDLEALASASVDWSSDDGQTWVMGNPAASEGVVDRQWLASDGETVYFTANYFSPPGRRVLASTDGIVWEEVGQIPGGCGSDFVASPLDGTLYAGCGAGVAVSTDGGSTWEQRMVKEGVSSGLLMTEPAIDSAGNVWLSWAENETDLYLAGSPDNGNSWPWVHEVNASVQHALDGVTNETVTNHTVVWPWVSAGSEGRVALSVFATPTPPPSAGGPSDRLWSVVTVAALDADRPDPVAHGYVLKEGHHQGPICQSGTTCQVGSVQGEENSDRRLGDFFETTIDHKGRLHVAYSDTTQYPDDVVSHPGYVRQNGGPSFLANGSDFIPTQG